MSEMKRQTAGGSLNPLATRQRLEISIDSGLGVSTYTAWFEADGTMVVSDGLFLAPTDRERFTRRIETHISIALNRLYASQTSADAGGTL